MSKLWCIGLALGDPANGMVVVSIQINQLQEMAVAQAMSDVYRQTGTKLPLMGINVRELTREYLETALKAMAELEAKPPPVVQLVPPQQQRNVLTERPSDNIAHGLPSDETA